MQLTNEFDPIIEWAKERGIYEKGNIDAQFQKLLEEVEELRYGIETDDKAEVMDAVGDCVVVLANLAHIADLSIEDCINSAYNEIKNRKGEMINGTFVKEN